MKMIRIFPLALLIALTAAGYFGGRCGLDSTCLYSSFFHDNVFSIFEPVYIFSLFSIPAVAFLPFVSSKVWKRWLRFAVAWIILSIVVVVQAPEATNAWFSMFSYVKEDAARIMGSLFSLISVSLIAISALAGMKRR